MAFRCGWRASLGQPRMTEARTRRPGAEGDFFSRGHINLRKTSGLTNAPISSADLVPCGRNHRQLGWPRPGVWPPRRHDHQADLQGPLLASVAQTLVQKGPGDPWDIPGKVPVIWLSRQAGMAGRRSGSWRVSRPTLVCLLPATYTPVCSSNVLRPTSGAGGPVKEGLWVYPWVGLRASR